jgi:hypothetical protein
MRLLGTLALLMFAFVPTVAVAEETMTPGPAEEVIAAPEAEWQNVISLQIQAFREHDGVVALSFAGSGFKAAFPNPNLFYEAIYNSGYAPILESISHSFGEFEMLSEDAVVQLVKIVGPDQRLYNALYELMKEPDGWRVQGVQLSAEQGIGI